MSVKIGQLGDHYDPTIDPRFGKVGRQVYKDTGPLTKARMVTSRSCPLLAQSGHDPPGYSNCREWNNLDRFPAAPIAANAVTGNWVRPDWE